MILTLRRGPQEADDLQKRLLKIASGNNAPDACVDMEQADVHAQTVVAVLLETLYTALRGQAMQCISAVQQQLEQCTLDGLESLKEWETDRQQLVSQLEAACVE